MEELLRAQWQAVVGTTHRADDHFQRLLTRYREPHRRYHTVGHLASVLGVAEDLMGEVTVTDPAAVRLALFFHDAVYDPRSQGNEADSAALAATVLPDLGVEPARVDAVAEMVMATRDHVPPSPTGAAGGADARGDAHGDVAVVLDADLEILAAEPARYRAYMAGVRAEYAHVDDAGWRVGRAGVLRVLLARPTLFLTAPMQRREHRARANLTAELAGLSSP